MKPTLCIAITAALVVAAPTFAAKAPEAAAANIVNSLESLQFDQLGHPQIKSDAIKPVLAPASRPHKLLVLPVKPHH